MSVQDNKFPIVLGAVTAVAVGGLLWWGLKGKGRYDVAKDSYQQASSAVSRLTKAPIYPDREKLQEKEKNVSNYATEVTDMMKAYDPYRATKLDNIAVGEFTDNLRAAREEVVKAMLDANPEVEIPEDFYVGQRKFTTNPPSQSITGVLSYQLEGIKKMMLLLAQAKPSKLNNVHRPDLPEENGREVEIAGKTYRAHPVEISFTGREETLRDFISLLDDQEDYYYVIRSIRLKNERQTAPQAKDARFEQPKPPPAASNPFESGGFVFPTEDEGTDDGGGAGEEVPAEEPAPVVPEAPADSGEVLKRVLGGEKVNVFMRIDILQFLEAKPLPER